MATEGIVALPKSSACSKDAAFWFARLRSESHTEQDLIQFEDWLARDPANEQEYNQYCAIWSKLSEFSEEPEIVQMRLQALAHLPANGVTIWWHRPAIVASFLIMLIVGSLVVGLHKTNHERVSSTAHVPRIATAPSKSDVRPVVSEPHTIGSKESETGPIELATSYSTPIGGHSVFTLPDGSVIELNTNTKVRVTYTQGRRDLDLLQGEAIFRVAKNRNRPFVVMTRNNQVTALGTAFVIRQDLHQTTVTLLEGKVKVEQFAGKADNGTVAQVTNLVAGQQLQASTNAGYQVRYADTNAASSWAKGRLYFENKRLAEVVAEVNRYTTKRLVLGEADLANMRISGQFRTASADSFAQTLAVSFPVEAIEGETKGQVILNRRKNTP